MVQLAAYVCELSALRSMEIKHHMGRAIHRFFYTIMRRYDPSLAERLHKDRHALKPFAVSGLLQPGTTQNVLGKIAEGDRAWLRMVGLNSEVVDALKAYEKRCARARPVDEKIDDRIRPNWRVELFSSDSKHNAWAGRASREDFNQLSVPRKIEFQFSSPTSFRSDGNSIPLPNPDRVFGSLLDKWSAFTGESVVDGIHDFIRYMMVLSNHNISTQTLRFKKKNNVIIQVGFQGLATFTLLKRNKDLEKKNNRLHTELMQRHTEFSSIVARLAALVFYAGVGIKTTQGMGMVCPQT